MCRSCALVGSRCSVSLQHGSRSPACQTLQISLAPTFAQPLVRERVTEKMRVDLPDPGCYRSITHHLIDTVVGHRPCMSQPQCVNGCITMLSPNTEIAI